MNKNFSRVIVKASLICFAANIFMLVTMLGRAAIFYDFDGQWALNAYALNGLDPYQVRGLETPLIEEIGTIRFDWSTMPWGLVLGNFFYPGFLSATSAAIYLIVMNVFFLLITARYLAKNLKVGLDGRIIFLVTTTAFLAHFAISTCFGNAGAIICCLLIICCLQADESPIFAGMLLSLAMVKPQVALPICFALLLRKNFKVLLTAAAIDLAAWLVACVMTGELPWILLRESLTSGAGGDGVFSGLFTLIFPENKSLAMLTSMTAGALFIWLTFRDEKNFWMCPACLTTTFFAYSFWNEFFILILPALMCLKFAVRAEIFREKIFWLATVIFMASAPYAMFLSLKNLLVDSPNVFWLTRTIFAVVIIVIGFLMARQIDSACKKFSRRL